MAGRFFGFGKNKEKDKQPRGKQKQQTSLDDEDNDDAYIDSDISCPTEPPQSRVLIPNYPPPRPGSPRTQQKTNQQASVRFCFFISSSDLQILIKFNSFDFILFKIQLARYQSSYNRLANWRSRIIFRRI